MSEPLLETVPNFSEGRDWDVIEGLVDAFKSTDDVAYLDLHLDEDHNRSVITAAGPPDPIRTALKKSVEVAIDGINIKEHEGTHPFMGAVDVIPLVPLEDTTMEQARSQAEFLGEELANSFSLPVFLYANAATRKHTKELSSLRTFSQDELDQNMQNEDRWKPDFGPDHCHETAGATAVGSRGFLIAMNVDLLTSNPEHADTIAKRIRESSGGLPGIQALGMNLEEQGRITVSTNITDFRKTSPYELVNTIHNEAEKLDVKPGPTELVGLIPQESLKGGDPEDLHIPRFDPNRHVLEQRLETVRSERD